MDLCPERLMVWLEHRLFGATVEAFFDVESKSSNRDVLVFAAEVAVPIHGARPPVFDDLGQDTVCVDRPCVKDAVFLVGESVCKANGITPVSFNSR